MTILYQIKLSDNHFEHLRSDAYDLGTVLEESQEVLESIGTYNIPSYDKVVTGCVCVCTCTCM